MDGEARMGDAMITDSSWRIEKKIPVALLGAILMQTFVVGAWCANLTSRVSTLETNNVNPAAFAVLSEKMTQVQSNSAETKQDIGSVKNDIGSMKDNQAGMKQDIMSLKEEIRRSGFNAKR